MKVYIEPIGTLINAFSKLPGVGLKTAQRYAYKIVNMPPEEAEAFAAAILSAKKNVHYCKICGNFTDEKRGRHLRGEGAERRHRHRKAERI